MSQVLGPPVDGSVRTQGQAGGLGEGESHEPKNPKTLNPLSLYVCVTLTLSHPHPYRHPRTLFSSPHTHRTHHPGARQADGAAAAGGAAGRVQAAAGQRQGAGAGGAAGCGARRHLRGHRGTGASL